MWIFSILNIEMKFWYKFSNQFFFLDPHLTITAGPPLRPEEQGPRLPGSAPSHRAQAMLEYMLPSLMSHTGLYTWGHTHEGSREKQVWLSSMSSSQNDTENSGTSLAHNCVKLSYCSKILL